VTSPVYGAEYVAVALVVVALVFVFSERAQQALHFLYHPMTIFVVALVFVEYLILKARDRTYVLEREIELQQRKRRELETAVRDCRTTLDTMIASMVKRPTPLPIPTETAENAPVEPAVPPPHDDMLETLRAMRRRLDMPAGRF